MGRWQPEGLTEGHEVARQTSKRMVVQARQLRKEMSLPEVLLWRELRRSGLRFRRQHPSGPFVLDFYCPSARLAIEVDGIAHDMGNRSVRDEERTAFLKVRGIDVMRVAAVEILNAPATVAEALVMACRERCGQAPPPSLLPQGRSPSP
ncbi:DUF559 domain-containing protein [Erythrobacter sp. SG61-1L]|uniref:endonuclease domain-containing protein n=1 Tax=Erythrobacter sp. SG61-1L TaxID=1603897 RepID=UPI0009E846C0|nr:DUF559 domain-containing protein [Erythrobacter sp. SG61-1L]